MKEITKIKPVHTREIVQKKKQSILLIKYKENTKVNKSRNINKYKKKIIQLISNTKKERQKDGRTDRQKERLLDLIYFLLLY